MSLANAIIYVENIRKALDEIDPENANVVYWVSWCWIATPCNIHFTHILFGNLLGIERTVIIQTMIIGALAIIAVTIRVKDLILFCFDPCLVSVISLSPARLELFLLVLIAATTVAALQVTGGCLSCCYASDSWLYWFFSHLTFFPMLLVVVTSALRQLCSFRRVCLLSNFCSPVWMVYYWDEEKIEFRRDEQDLFCCINFTKQVG